MILLFKSKGFLKLEEWNCKCMLEEEIVNFFAFWYTTGQEYL